MSEHDGRSSPPSANSEQANSDLAAFESILAELAAAPVGGGIELLLGSLAPADARLLRLCGIPVRFGRRVLQALDPSLPTDIAEAKFRDFAELSIVKVEPDRDVAQLHDETRAYLLSQWHQPENRNEFAAASARLATLFDGLAKEATNVGDAERLQYLATYHAVGANAEAGFQRFHALFRERRHAFRTAECEQLVRLIAELEPILAPALRAELAYRRGQVAADSRRWAEARQQFATVLENPYASDELRVRALNRMGMAAAAARDFRLAIVDYEAALTLAEESPTARNYTYHILRDLGAAFRDVGDLERATSLLKQSIHFAQSAGDLCGVAVGYNSLGMVMQISRDTGAAIRAYEESLRALDASGDTIRQAQVYDNLAVAHADRGDWSNSGALHERSLAIARQAGDLAGQAMTLNNLSRVYHALRQPERGFEASREAILLFECVGDIYRAAVSRRNLGRGLRRAKQWAAAREALEQAAREFERASESAEAQATRTEAERLGQRVGLPWWVWVAMLLFLSMVGLFVWLLASS